MRLNPFALLLAASLILGPAMISFGPPAFAQNASAEQLWERGLQIYNTHDYRDALPILIQAARMGNPRAQALVGIMYQRGQGVPASDQNAVPWFEMAAAQGHRAAQFALGTMYEEGDGGLPKNVALAAQYYLASAHQGFYLAEVSLGLSYEFGAGVPRNRATAIYWLDQAAAQGDGQAHWIADWLRRPDTPYFQNPAQLGSYIGSRVQQYYTPSARAGLGCSTPVACSQMMGVRMGQVKTNGGGGDVQP